MAVNVGTLEYDIRVNIKQLNQATRDIEQQNKKTERSFNALGVAAAAYVGYRIAKSFVDIADNAKLLDVRIRAVSKSQTEFVNSQKELVRIAAQTGASLGDTVKLFEALKLSAGELGASNSEVIRFTESINKLGVVSGASPEALGFAVRQLNQSLAAGIVRAEEFNSVVENTPAIARSIAKGLGVSNGELRTMVVNGKLLSEDVLKAILSQTDEIDKRFSLIPETVAKAASALKTEFSQLLKTLDESSKLTGFIADTITQNAEAIKKINQSLIERKSAESAIEKIMSSQTGEQAKQLEKAKELFDEIEKKQNKKDSGGMLGFFKNQSAASKAYFERYEKDQQKSIESDEKELAVLMMQNSAVTDLWRARQKLSDVKNGVYTTNYGKKSAVDVETDSDPVKPVRVETDAEKAARERAEAKAAREAKRAEEERKRKAHEFADLMADMSNETDQILLAYEDRNNKILELTKAGSAEQTEALIKSEQMKNEQLAEIKAEESKIVMDASQQQRAFEESEKEAAMARYSDLANDTLTAMQRAGKDQTAVAKAIFLSLKALQVAEIIASTEVAAVKAGAVASIGGPFAFLTTQQGIRAAGYASAGIVAGLGIADAFTGGGREAGGPVFAGAIHPINERGDPEVLQMGARQFLLPGNKSGTVMPLNNAGGKVGGMPRITINNNGSPLTVSSTSMSDDEIRIIVKNAENNAVSRVNSSLSNGRGTTANALRSGFKAERNIR